MTSLPDRDSDVRKIKGNRSLERSRIVSSARSALAKLSMHRTRWDALRRNRGAQRTKVLGTVGMKEFMTTKEQREGFIFCRGVRRCVTGLRSVPPTGGILHRF